MNWAPMQVDQAMTRKARSAFAEQATVEEVIALLRAAGCSKPDTVKVLIQARGFSLRGADASVHQSATWADVFEADNALRNDFFDALEALAADPELEDRLSLRTRPKQAA